MSTSIPFEFPTSNQSEKGKGPVQAPPTPFKHEKHWPFRGCNCIPLGDGKAGSPPVPKADDTESVHKLDELTPFQRAHMNELKKMTKTVITFTLFLTVLTVLRL